jgi:hypothetical protein
MILSPTNPLALVLAGLTLSLAAVVAWFGGSLTAYWIAAILVLVAALIPQSLLLGARRAAAPRQAARHLRAGRVRHHPLRRHHRVLDRPAHPHHRDQRRAGAHQGHRAREHRCDRVLAGPRSRARGAGDRRLPAGHHTRVADLAPGNGRLLAALDAAVGSQAG